MSPENGIHMSPLRIPTPIGSDVGWTSEKIAPVPMNTAQAASLRGSTANEGGTLVVQRLHGVVNHGLISERRLRLPELDTIALGVYHPTELAVVVLFNMIVNRSAGGS
jgi:hypothetical protein